MDELGMLSEHRHIVFNLVNLVNPVKKQNI